MSDQPLQQTSNPNRAAGLGPPLEIRIQNLYKSFGGRRVLDGVNLEAHRGEMIALVGGSGGGKHLVDLGTLNASRMERLKRHWTVVFQGNALLSGLTVAYNVALPLREVQHLDESAVRTRVDEVIREVALGPEKDLGLTPDQLSGGMAKFDRQRRLQQPFRCLCVSSAHLPAEATLETVYRPVSNGPGYCRDVSSQSAAPYRVPVPCPRPHLWS